MKPCEVLMGEHRVIEAVLNCLEKATDAATEKVDGETFRKSIQFFRTFADGCHHHKEEELLFPALEDHGVPREGGPIGVMLEEHEFGRQCLRGMDQALSFAEQGDDEARQQLVAHAREYIAMLRDHIVKEDEILFPLADSHLAPEEQEQMLARFHNVEKQLGAGTHGCQVGAARALCQQWQVAFPEGVATSCGGH